MGRGTAITRGTEESQGSGAEQPVPQECRQQVQDQFQGSQVARPAVEDLQLRPEPLRDVVDVLPPGRGTRGPSPRTVRHRRGGTRPGRPPVSCGWKADTFQGGHGDGAVPPSTRPLLPCQSELSPRCSRGLELERPPANPATGSPCTRSSGSPLHVVPESAPYVSRHPWTGLGGAPTETVSPESFGPRVEEGPSLPAPPPRPVQRLPPRHPSEAPRVTQWQGSV